jgi:hypothetical protein
METSKKTIGGYYVNQDQTAIISMYREIEVVDIPDNFIVSPNVNNEVLKISNDGERIEVVTESVRERMNSRRRKNEVET